MSPDDICQCGDPRKDHIGGMGECCLNSLGHDGAPACMSFRLSSHAPEDTSVEAARIAELEEENAVLRETLRPFALKATKWEANHPRKFGFWPVSSSVTHRLGDFRAARSVLAKYDPPENG